MKKLFTIFTLIVLFSINSKAQSFSAQSGTMSNSNIDSCSSTQVDVMAYLGCINWQVGGSSFSVSGTTIDVRVDCMSSFICAGAISYPNYSTVIQNIPAGSYTVTATAYLDNNPTNTITIGPLTVSNCTTTSIKETNINDSFEIFPNPTSQFVNIKNIEEQSRVSILDLKGSSVFSKVLFNDDVLNIEALSPGVYFLRIETASSNTIKKLVIN